MERLSKLKKEERETGVWIETSENHMICSCCTEMFIDEYAEFCHDYKYCPNCGARMEGE